MAKLQKKTVAFQRLRTLPSIISSQPGLGRGLWKAWVIFKEVWLYDIQRPGVTTGFVSRSDYHTLSSAFMWYSPSETRTSRDIIDFCGEWFTSYFTYSKSDVVPVFVDFGAGAAKPNIQAIESRKFAVSIAFELDDTLLAQAASNFQAMAKRSGDFKAAVAFKGDVASKGSIEKLREKILETVGDKSFVLCAYNKNSYGPETLREAIALLDQVFGSYVYMYQKPVHRRVLEEAGLVFHRLVLDPKLRKNRDWLLAART